MKRDYKLYIKDILESIKQLREYTNGTSEEQFTKDKKLQDAVIRRIEIIGEAIRNIPGALKVKNKNIPWFELAQFRDLIVHSYFEASIKRIWKIATKDIPNLKENFENIKMI